MAEVRSKTKTKKKKSKTKNETNVDNTEEKGNDDINEQIISSLINSGEPITLNVGGYKHQTTLFTLLRYKDSVLCKMFEGKFSLKPCKDGSYFIDRNGKYFDIILDYLRSATLILPTTDRDYIIRRLMVESQYYNIEPLTVELATLAIKINILTSMQIHEFQKLIHPERAQKYQYNWKTIREWNVSEGGYPNLKRVDSYDCTDHTFIGCGHKNILVVAVDEGVIKGIYEKTNMIKDKHHVQEGFGFILKHDSVEKVDVDVDGKHELKVYYHDDDKAFFNQQKVDAIGVFSIF